MKKLLYFLPPRLIEEIPLYRRTYRIYSPRLDQSFAISYFLNKYYKNSCIVGVSLPSETVPRYGKYYDHICTLHDVNTQGGDIFLIPTGANSTKHILERQDITLGSVKLTKDALRCYDKSWLIKQATKIGVSTPTTWQNISDVSMYPIFYKQRYEKGGGVRGIAHNERDIPYSGRNELIFQELIKGKGTYGVGFIAKRGQILASNIHYERESLPKEGGSAIIIERFNDERLLMYTEHLIETLHYSGWGLAEFKYCPHRDDFVFMEINAKFWASCEFAFINEPLFLELLFGIDSREKPIQRLVFVSRAFVRGIPFIFQNLHYFATADIRRVYPGWFRQVGVGLLSPTIRQKIKMFVKHKN